jgi:hypothetical protein
VRDPGAGRVGSAACAKAMDLFETPSPNASSRTLRFCLSLIEEDSDEIEGAQAFHGQDIFGQPGSVASKAPKTTRKSLSQIGLPD